MPELELPDATLAYHTAGDHGPRVLLVQGVGSVGEGWRPQIEALRRDHRLVWFDNRGVGGSRDDGAPLTMQRMGEDCIALLDHLGWERAHIAGHSMGGMIVQEAAALAPERFISLSLLSTAPRGRQVLALPPKALWPALMMRFGGEERRWRHFTALAFPPAFLREIGKARAVELLRGAFVEDFVRMPLCIRRQMAAMWRHRGADLSQLRSHPALILTGSHDLTVNTRFSDELQAALPNARLERFTDAAHALPLQYPAAVSRLLRQHFADASSAA